MPSAKYSDGTHAQGLDRPPLISLEGEDWLVVFFIICFYLCVWVVVGEYLAVVVAFCSHYGSANLAESNAVSPAFSVQGKGNRDG